MRFLSSFRPQLKVALFVVSLIPLALMVHGVIENTLGPDPATALSHQTGIWSLNFLLLSLAITPLHTLTHNSAWIHYRRMLGLFAFFYAVLHLMVYIAFLLAFRWSEIWLELQERPYITVGFIALLLLLPLAVTSTRGWQKRLKQKWKRLHQLVYLAMIFILLHFIWQIRSDFFEPLLYASIFTILMLLRWPRLKKYLSMLTRRKALAD